MLGLNFSKQFDFYLLLLQIMVTVFMKPRKYLNHNIQLYLLIVSVELYVVLQIILYYSLNLFNNCSPKVKVILLLGTDYSTIFPEPQENNNYYFSVIAQVIITAAAFSFILFISSSKTSRNRAVSILKIRDT